MVVKGVPPLILDLQKMYENSEKKAAIGEMLLAWYTQMGKNMKLDETDEDEQDPTITLWLMYYLANHHCFSGEYADALKYIEEAI